MKYVILTVFVAGAVAGSVGFLKRAKPDANSSYASNLASVSELVSNTAAASRIADASSKTTSSSFQADQASSTSPVPAQSSVPPIMDKAAVSEAVDLLLSTQVPYSQRSAAWKQLREKGGMDWAIHELEQRFAANPGNAQCVAVLGHAYLQKCGMISDVRDQGMFAMQADKLFDAALESDPQNWEARFTKAVALSYWPASMGKSDEVVQHFLTLIQQQETQPSQPQFAQSYVWLGDQYQKAGHRDEAHDAWVRGAALYPADQQLAGRLASSP